MKMWNGGKYEKAAKMKAKINNNERKKKRKKRRKEGEEK